MKKAYVAILMMLLLLLIGCGKNEENISDETGGEYSLTGVVLDISEESVHMSVLDNEIVLSSGDEITFSITDSLRATNDFMPRAGDTIAVTIKDQIAESFPLQVEAVSWSPVMPEDVSIGTEEGAADYPAMIMVDGTLYYDSGEISGVAKCGVMDGEITDSVDTVPKKDDQSNFGTGYGYQYGMENQIDVYIDHEWHIFIPYEKTEQENDNLTEQEKMEQDPAYQSNADKTTHEVVIKAHIKEINGKTMVISSDSNGYPGAFLADVPEGVADVSEFAGGDAIVIHMIDENREQDGMKVFQAYHIDKQDELTDETGHLAVLLTGAPVITLSDALSSSMGQLELQLGNYGNYEWNYKDNGQMEGGVTCGAAPLDKEEADYMPVLTIPDYNGLESVVYSVRAVISPDSIVLKEWDISDIGNLEAEPKRVVDHFCQPYFFKMKKNAVYEITAVWERSNLDVKGFCGKASYVVRTQ